MNSVERVKSICKERKLPISKIEKELGFSNGYIGQLKKGNFPDDRLLAIADYLNVSVNYLMTGEELANPTLTTKDQRDIAKELESIMEKLDNGEDGPVRYNGQIIDDNSRILLRNALELGLTQLKVENKKLYNPNKNKK